MSSSLPSFFPGPFSVLLLSVIFAFSNGFRDSSSIVATVVSTRVLSPNMAFFLCACFEFIGAMFLGSAVAHTIGSKVIGTATLSPSSSLSMILSSGLMAAIIWGILSWWRVWPISNNHALFAGLVGASWAAGGTSHIQNKIILLVLSVLVLSPFIGFLLSALLTRALRFLGEWMTPKVNFIAETLHVAACSLVSCAHGSNDGQMVMGVLMGALGVAPWLDQESPRIFMGVPMHTRFLVAVAISSGVLMGGRRILKKVGMTFYQIRPPQGLGAQLTAAGTVLSCLAFGFPASTTQVITGSIVGAGVAKNPRSVRWHIGQEIVWSWLLTIPSVGLLAYLICKLINTFTP